MELYRSSEGDLALAEERIAWVLMHPDTSAWMKEALRLAMAVDPVVLANDVELLRHLLVNRTDAIVQQSLNMVAK